MARCCPNVGRTKKLGATLLSRLLLSKTINNSMITITQLAKDYMASVSNGGHVTLGVKSGGCAGFEYIWGLSTDDGIEHVKWSNPIEDVLLVDPMAEMYIIGSEIDYVNELGGSYLKIVNPVQTSSCGCGSSFGV
jgi:iron-sulfur cluster assembly accessory protein